MYTIFVDGKGNGARATGLGYSQFVETFDAICQEHVRGKRAKAFAFIFYDINHGSVRSALKSARGFEILNAETGKDITLFYLHAAATELHANTFNLHFMQALGVADQISLPCIVFFRVTGDEIGDINFRCIDDQVDDEHLIVEALRRDIAEYTASINAEGDLSPLTKVAGWLSKTAFTLALKHIF
ncbi:hypothetical protein [Pectobacterium versatile]|uniref:hypothetical protein n=1 Tax=Pectobacterium versatile TaxID=2488639 RepID=UPI001CCDC340|nr:hypothetical protein [Pectobacterium versatile]